jgi:hypothetical protein
VRNDELVVTLHHNHINEFLKLLTVSFLRPINLFLSRAISRNYFSSPPPPARIFQVTDAYSLSRETACVALSFLDRYLTSASCNKKVFQLASMCSLFLASKLLEARPVRMVDLVGLSRGVFKDDDLRAMEKVMLRTLKWHLHPPTPASFVRMLLDYMHEKIPVKAMKAVLELSEFNTELSVCEYSFLKYSPSTIAVASILNAFEKTKDSVTPELVQEWSNAIHQDHADLDLSSAHLTSCRVKLVHMYNQSGVEDANLDCEIANANSVSTPNFKGSRGEKVISPTSVTDNNTNNNNSNATAADATNVEKNKNNFDGNDDSDNANTIAVQHRQQQEEDETSTTTTTIKSLSNDSTTKTASRKRNLDEQEDSSSNEEGGANNNDVVTVTGGRKRRNNSTRNN